MTGITGVALAADQAVNATKLGGATVTATTSVTFPPTCTVATTTGAVGSVAGNVSGDVVGNIGGDITGNVNGTVTLHATANDTIVAGAVWDAATVTYGAAGSYGLVVETNLDAAVSSRMATYTQPTGFLAAVFDAGTVANTTNITGGTITTVTTTGTCTTNTDMLTAAAVNAEVVDALSVDTYAEPTGAPASTDALATKIGYVYMALRNKIDVDSGFKEFYDDAGNVEWKKVVADSGTNYSEAKGIAGP